MNRHLVRAEVRHRSTCRGCLSTELTLILRMTPTPPGDHYVTAEALGNPQPAYPMDLMMCGACGLAQLPDVVDPELLYRDYIYNTSVSLGLVQHFDRYAASVLTAVAPRDGSLVIDIGSNDGTLLKGFAKRGMRVLGVDPAREVARRATDDGLETMPTFFSSSLAAEIRRERGPAAIVTANNVFANVDDLDDLMKGVREVLASDGVFVFETGYFPDLVRQRIIDNIYHEHLTYYAVKPLVKLFERYDMELESVWHEPTKGGSIRGFVRPARRSKRRMPPANLDELIGAETADGFDRPEALSGFAQGVEALKHELGGLVTDLRRGGRTLAGYGASVGVTTLLYYFDLGDVLSFIVDDNPKRHGRFTPGHHLPVLPSSALYERRPDDVILLAWRYAEPITARHGAYLDAGGRFILPLPTLSISGPPPPAAVGV
jgi:SAM-dependent methyltransferase